MLWHWQVRGATVAVVAPRLQEAAVVDRRRIQAVVQVPRLVLEAAVALTEVSESGGKPNIQKNRALARTTLF